MAIGDKKYDLEINDSEFERIGWQNARYRGTKLTSNKIKKHNEHIEEQNKKIKQAQARIPRKK